MSAFVDEQMVRLRDPAQLAALVDPPGDTEHARVRALLAAMYTMDFATVRDVSDLHVRQVEFQRPVVAARRTSGNWFRSTPAYTRTEVALEQRDPLAPLWVDLSAEIDVTLLLEVDGGAVESVVTREITGVTSLDDFRSRFRFLDVDAFLRKHDITTVEELREAFQYLLTEIHLRAPGPFDPDDPANRHPYELRLAMLIRDTVDVASLLRDAKLARAAVESAVLPGEAGGAEIRTPYAPVLLIPAAVAPGGPLSTTALESFFAAEGVLALFV
ncbi:hypothetical protein [Streptomyces fumanus]|uniref:Uncharacterized protein n=1 Tax=Streptomyces fumanus TaxID=67302 RepID=A0A919ABI6_9ACTN|nr:hypothetical protein [Streptomyces fumanus]GHE97699.1 hypothetical protein GCM10018772_22480 [Streptomyces fumanus]